MPPHLVWMDMEMTGLDPEVDVILEIATIVTDSELNAIAEGPVLAVSQPESALARMNEWNTEHHTASGLIDRVRQDGVPLIEAEARTLDFLERHTTPDTSPLCGNTIWQDRRFLIKYMPEVAAFLHYRIIDVSSIKELAFRWHPELISQRRKANAHRALEDIRESIDELRFYRERFFHTP
ncbi:MAG: oligoribonuclease [Gammaproteobacteria bacterium]|nr:oligoribonuclease [Gammaproteobacteria bacterium]